MSHRCLPDARPARFRCPRKPRPETQTFGDVRHRVHHGRVAERSRWKNSWSIFTRRWAVLHAQRQCPPKSSMATLKPCSCGRFTWPITVSKSSTNAFRDFRAQMRRRDGGRRCLSTRRRTSRRKCKREVAVQRHDDRALVETVAQEAAALLEYGQIEVDDGAAARAAG